MGREWIQGLGYLAIEVRDLDAAKGFYSEGLGLQPLAKDRWPGRESSLLLAAGAQHLFLVENPDKDDASREGGTHLALRCCEEARKSIAARLEYSGAVIETYVESRPEEAKDNFYVLDPSGNRVQLVVADGDGGKGDDEGASGIDHACIEDFDLQWSEEFYSRILGLPVAYWHGLRTGDYVAAQDWGAGNRVTAPGCNRMVRYYRAIPGQNRMQARPTVQIFLRAGRELVGVYMAMEDYAEPPEGQLRGDTCIAFSVAPGGLGDIARALEEAGRKFIGPIAAGDDAPLGATIYSRDTGGNFLAFTEIV